MSNAQEIIRHKVQENGISISELARRSGLPSNRIKNAMEGKAKIKGADFLILCRVLKIETF